MRSNGAFEDCEYQGEGPTLSQLLDRRIYELKARISELEMPNKPRGLTSLTLRHPYYSRDSSPSTGKHWSSILSRFRQYCDNL